MPAVRLAMAQINPTVGDISGNSELIYNYCEQAAQAGAQLVMFPELALSGYPIEDLALSADFLDQCELAAVELAKKLHKSGLGSLRVLLGHPGRASTPTSWAIGQNQASLIYQGQVSSRYAKHHLPNYSVFDEYRVFVPGGKLEPFEIQGIKFAAVICEDIWQSGGPVAQLAENDVAVTLVLNGSPFETTKEDSRLQLVQNLARSSNTAVVYLNLVGGQDDLVFDGNSFVVDAAGSEITRAKQFESDLVIIDVESKTMIKPLNPSANRLGELGQIWQALVLGTRDYVTKNGFQSVILGLSGGIDSAVCAAIACDALGAENVHTVAMPSKYSSDHSISDAAELAHNFGLNHSVQQIEPMLEAFHSELHLTGVAAENLQARVRALILMGLSNQHGHLVLTTGNKTELAVGYSTIYGDSVGGFAPIKDVEKTLVWALARWRNSQAAGLTPPIPVSSIDKAPSAELRPNQTDQDTLPDYQLLDDILRGYIESRKSTSELTAAGFDAETVKRVVKMVKNAEWKRRQGAIGPRITKLAFGRERRFPITNLGGES
jgi:NAD+ synthase (glutamine-hydrolysing)